MQTTTDEVAARFDQEADDRSSLRKMLDRYNAPIAWGVVASYISYLSARLILPSAAAEKLLEGGVTVVGLFAVTISILIHRRK